MFCGHRTYAVATEHVLWPKNNMLNGHRTLFMAVEHVAPRASQVTYETTNGLIHPLIFGLEHIIKVMSFLIELAPLLENT